jgi:hypothetical protein
MHNVMKYLPGLAGSVMNETSTYPAMQQGNESYWYPQEVNSPLTDVETSVAANFFPVSYHFTSITCFGGFGERRTDN